MQFCNHCGAPITDAGSAYCPACGAARGSAGGSVQQPRVPRPEQPVYSAPAPVSPAPARGLQPQHILLIVLTLLVVTLGAVVLYLTRERPTEPGTITYAEAPAAEGETDTNSATVQPAATPAQPSATQPAVSQPGKKASAQTPAPSAAGAETWRGFSYHVPSGFALVSSGSSDARTYYNESLRMTITVTVLDTSDPYGVLERNKAAFDSDPSLRTTYSDGRDYWFVRSGYDGNGWVFYSKNKVYDERENTFASIDFSYPNDADKPTRDAILTEFVNDFGLS